MKAEKTVSINPAFVVTESDFKKLDEIIFPLGEVEYTAQVSNELNLKCENLDTFIRQASASNLFEQIQVHAVSFNGVSASIYLGSNKPRLISIWYKLEGSETEVTYLDSRMREWISDVTPWYSWLATFNIAILVLSIIEVVFFVVAIVAAAILFISVALSAISHKPLTTSALSLGNFAVLAVVFVSFGLLIGLIFGLIAFALQGLLNPVRSKLFPVVTFAVGRGYLEHKKLVRFRRIVAFFSSIIFSLALALLANWLSRG